MTEEGRQEDRRNDYNDCIGRRWQTCKLTDAVWWTDSKAESEG